MTRLRDKIPVEPLSPSRLARVEESVLAAYRDAELAPAGVGRTLATALRYLVPAVAVSGVALAVYLNLRAANEGQERSASVAPPRPTVTSVTTGVGESTTLELDDARVVVGAESAIEIERLASGEITVQLRDGRVDCDVEPREGRAPFAVRAGDVAVTVVGTAFSVERGDLVVVHVTRGKVHVDAPDGARSLAAGEEWSGRASRMAMAEPIAPLPEQAEATSEADTAGAVEVPNPDLHARAESRVPEPSKRGREAGDREIDRTSVAEGEKAAEGPAPDKERKPGSRAAVRAALPPLPDGYPKDPRAAFERYRESIGDRGKKERREMYHYAYLQLFVLNDSRAAIDAVETFQRRFRRGDLTEEMLALRMLATCGDGEPSADCRKAAHAYLARFANGEYAAFAQEIVDPM